MDKKEHIKNKLDKASLIYSENVVLRSIVNGIPGIGGSLDVLFSSLGKKYVSKRIETFLSVLQQEIVALDEKSIDLDYMTSETGYDLIIKAFDSTAKTRQKEKISLYARIIRNSLIKSKDFEEDEPYLYLTIIESLSIKELRVAKCLMELKEKKIQEEKEQNQRWSWNPERIIEQYPEFNPDDLVSILIRLERTGLIKEVVGTYLGYMGGAYSINPLFDKLMQFLKEN